MKKSILLIALALVCSVSAKAEQKEVSCGSTVKITATAKPGYHFVQWSDGVTNASRDLEDVRKDSTLTAEFAHDAVEIKVAVKDDEGGYVTMDGVKQSSKLVDYESTVELEAIPQDDCWVFEKWDDNNTDNPRIVTATAAATYTAIFKIKQIKITANVNVAEWGSVEIN